MENRFLVKEIVENIEKVIIGKEKEILNILKGIIAGGHILIEDVPGVGKTTLVKALAKSIDLSYNRVQFTPDLLPSDITGVSIYNQKTGEFEFKKGPIFSNIVLADEINRTSPKTQSALLEVMEERQVSEWNNTYKLESPFIVMATQNPIEYEGTFNLPEAQLDRFMIKASIGYPEKNYEQEILKVYKQRDPLGEINNVVSKDQIIKLQKEVRDSYVSDDVTSYIVDLIDATRNNKYFLLGGSTRAALSLQKIAQAEAFISDRDYVIPEDVKKNINLVLSHRLILSSYAKANKVSVEEVLNEIIHNVSVPKIK